ncbi:DEAD/DEAH box helicase family protein [uncultured Thiodictyon sp.]|uniref:DEAD/DEAH box helicase family protein n=1 Tax=uncultured Thiodictyon sp. TaxID=1846217 RepID=UPI0025FD407A|nr:DEAD/DEAH box helicase family protein [uncultured Thiodictyon sp.]
MSPEEKARQIIEQRLGEAGWVIQDLKAINLGAARGLAVREYPTATGPADYVLFIDREPVGILEAKRAEADEHLTSVEEQTLRYAVAALKWRGESRPLPFLFESTGAITRFTVKVAPGARSNSPSPIGGGPGRGTAKAPATFIVRGGAGAMAVTDARDPALRSREVFHFFRPEHLAHWLTEPDTLRRRLAHALPPLPTTNLRECQIGAVTGLECSLAHNRPRALAHMATGSGKTFAAITAVYRLLKFAGAVRLLFLVDTRNLGKQAHQEFMAYTPPDDARKFTELYNVQRLTIETFDFIIINECHRSIYNLWKQVLDYFDAFLIGLTATPDQRTFGFFNENIVAEYTYEPSVADGVNVGYGDHEERGGV